MEIILYIFLIMKLGTIINKIENFYKENKPNDQELKMFIENDILKVDKCKQNEIKRLDQEFEGKTFEEKYNLLVNKYLDLCLDREITYLTTCMAVKQASELALQIQELNKDTNKIKRKLEALKHKISE